MPASSCYFDVVVELGKGQKLHVHYLKSNIFIIHSISREKSPVRKPGGFFVCIKYL